MYVYVCLGVSPAGTCVAHLGDLQSASNDLQLLLQHPVIAADGESYEDLFMLVVQELCKLGQAPLALPFMEKLRGQCNSAAS